jgi:hypothetical protein
MQYSAFGIATMIGHVFDFVIRRSGWAKQNMIDSDFSVKIKGIEEWTVKYFYQFYLMASSCPKWKNLCDLTMKLIPCDSTMTNVASLSIYTY